MRWATTALYGLLCYVCGSVLFWLPDGVYHFLRGGDLRGIDFIILTGTLPGIIAAGWLLLARRASGLINGMLTSSIMLLGILTTCPLWVMSVNFTFDGGGFGGSIDWRQLGILTLLFPLSDLDLSTYDGTLFALGISMVGLFMLPIICNPRGIEPRNSFQSAPDPVQ